MLFSIFIRLSFCSFIIFAPMNFETLIAFIGVIGGVETIKWLLTFRSSKLKADAEASEQLSSASAARNRMYEESILFLQSQLKEKEKSFADLSQQLHKAMEAELDLTRQLGNLQLRFLSSRCDKTECPHREPPFEWVKIKAPLNKEC